MNQPPARPVGCAMFARRPRNKPLTNLMNERTNERTVGQTYGRTNEWMNEFYNLKVRWLLNDNTLDYRSRCYGFKSHPRPNLNFGRALALRIHSAKFGKMSTGFRWPASFTWNWKWRWTTIYRSTTASHVLSRHKSTTCTPCIHRRRHVRPPISKQAANTIEYSIVLSRLDYCNRTSSRNCTWEFASNARDIRQPN